MIRCTTAAGSGAGLAWTVSISQPGVPGSLTWNASSAATGASTAYISPSITAVVRWQNGAPAPAQLLSTAGGDALMVYGSNLAPFNASDLALSYWSFGGNGFVYAASSCFVFTPSIAVLCTSAPGIGANLRFSVRVGGQSSDTFNGSTVTYAPPAVTAVSMSAVVSAVPGLLDTAGGDT